MSHTPHMTVCICTYERPELLLKLLGELERLETQDRFSYSLVIVDNDAGESARETVSRFASGSNLDILYLTQPVRSIALTRNAAVAEARGEFVAFVDDDEFPDSKWLVELLRTWEDYKADGVLGPVLPYFEENAPPWIRKAGLYDRPNHQTGRRLEWLETRTGNCLLRRTLFTDDGLGFNPEFQSGSDQQFFREAIDKGCVFVWSHDALIYEVVPPARWKAGFLIRRAVFRGIFAYRKQPYALRPILWSLVMVPAYLIALPITLLLGQAKFMRYAFSFFYHVGRLLGLMKINPIREQYVTE